MLNEARIELERMRIAQRAAANVWLEMPNKITPERESAMRIAFEMMKETIDMKRFVEEMETA